MKTNDIQGAVTEHWMVKRLRQHKPINDPTNLIRISAVDILKLVEYKNQLLGTKRSVLEESQESDQRREQLIGE